MPAGGGVGHRRSGPGQYPMHQQHQFTQQLQQRFTPQQQQYPQNTSIYPQQEWNRAQISSGCFDDMNFVPKVDVHFMLKMIMDALKKTGKMIDIVHL